MFSIKNFSLQRIFGKEQDFFDLLTKSVEEACGCAKALETLLKNPSEAAPLEELRRCRGRNKQYLDQVSELVVETFVTALDREDIEALASTLYKIPKPIEKFADRYIISKDRIAEFLFFQQADIIEASTQKVREMLALLRKGNSIEKVRALNTELQQLESNADTIMNDLTRELFTKEVAPIKVIILRDLYDLLERAVDRCRDAGNVISHVCLKNS